EFSRNGRFLCTHPLGLSSGRFPSVFLLFLRFQLYQIRFPFRSRFGFHFRWPLEAFAFRLIRLYQKFSAGLTGFRFRMIGSGFS
ncbi:hypothetical protein, partial [Streptomyces sp. NPDC047123]|uniref:hypothetical protein n=1 Tax=Streptomyces sp. NPDC047123 TaxID=3155622 RepID=UPI0033EC95EF